MTTCLVRFSLGPVQSFIETARSSRDLWSGSFLLSWLAAHAANALPEGSKFLSPVMEANPLFEAVRHQSALNGERQIACLPNTFTARVDCDDPREIATLLRGAVEREWREIASAVHDWLCKKWADYPDWDMGWEEQICDAFEVRVAILPAASSMTKITEAELNRLDGALKMIRGWPQSHEPDTLRRSKCNLCGIRSQTNPRALREWEKPGQQISTEEWKKLCDETSGRGERLRPADRLCAVCSTKRFAWAQYFSHWGGGVNPTSLSIEDTGTLAAQDWLKKGEGIFPPEFPEQIEQNDSFSGGWFHWSRPDQGEAGGDGTIPETIWEQIYDARKRMRKAGLPARPRPYLAILMADGDNMGHQFRELGASLSGNLQQFATQCVPEIIKRHNGTLIYSGGDDTLAFLPLGSALACAREFRAAFKETTGCNLSAGLAIVHYKQDLRESLAAARDAEKKAKSAGRDRLALAVHPRGGAGHTAIIPWDQFDPFEALLSAFSQGFSDRWLYRLRHEMESLNGSKPLETLTEILDLEFHRILCHADRASREEKETAEKVWKILKPSMDTLNAMLAAAFIARGGEE